MKEQMHLEISAWAIIKVLLIISAFYLLFLIKDVLLLLFVVLILVATFRPTINRWEKKLTRIGAVTLLAILMVAVISFIIYVIFPPLISQIHQLITSIPKSIDKFRFLAPYKDVIESGIKSMLNNAGSITGGFYNATVSAFSGIVTALLALVMTIYLLLDKDGLKNFIVNLVPDDSQSSVIKISSKMALKIGSWFRGQLFLVSCIAILDFVGLTIIGIPYALTLGVLAGLFDFIPVIGPIAAGIIACLIALSIAPIKVIFVAALFIIVQQVENTVLVPKIMQKAVGISPVVIILALLIGSRLLGLMGALLAVPTAALLSVVVAEWSNIKRMIRNENAS